MIASFTSSPCLRSHFVISLLKSPENHRNVHTNPIYRYKFDQTDREVFESTLEAALNSGDVPELKSTQDIPKYADFIVTAIRETQIYPQVKFLGITFDSKCTFQKHQVSPNRTVSQQKMGTQPVHHMTIYNVSDQFSNMAPFRP